MHVAAPARAEGWCPGADEAEPEASTAAEFDMSIRGAYAPGMVPQFRAGERTRASVGADARVWVGPRVRLSLSQEWLLDSAPATDPVSGLGDFRLGTSLKVWHSRVVAVGLGWEAKLPNAADETGLGTDETDSAFGGWSAVTLGNWSTTGAVGLAVLGNPLRFANQDDVPMARLGVAYTPGDFRFSLGGRADFATSRNPDRAELFGSARYGRAVYGELSGTAGLTPAAADGSVILRLGYRLALPTRPPGE